MTVTTKQINDVGINYGCNSMLVVANSSGGKQNRRVVEVTRAPSSVS